MQAIPGQQPDCAMAAVFKNRSHRSRMAILQALERKRVAVRILNLGMDTQTPTGKLMLPVLGGRSI